jgi:5-methylthioadenosine/S-adenosylhomocysteine deaminase
MNQLLIQNVSLFNSKNTIEKYDLLVNGNTIKSLNTANSFFASDIQGEVIDGSDFIALPGLMNCHTHIPMILFRGFAEDLNLNDWLTQKIFPLEAKLSEELVLYGAMMGIAELIHSGCTYFADMYFFMESVAKAVDISGIRANLAIGLIDQNGEKGLKQSEVFFNKFNQSAEGRIQVFLGPHAPYTCSSNYLKQVSSLAKSLQTGIHIHLNETDKEVQDYKEQHGKRPIKALREDNFFGTPIICAHCVNVDSEEIKILKDINALVAHNPSSNMKLGSGVAPIQDLIQNDVQVSLGTDGAASNNQLNMFKEMHLASLLSKVSSKKGSSLPADTVFKMGTEIPGQYLFNGKLGIIKEDTLADIILIKLSNPSLFPNDNISKSMIHSFYGNEVDTVIINGKIIMKGRHILTMDEKEIQKKANQLIRDAYQC